MWSPRSVWFFAVFDFCFVQQYRTFAFAATQVGQTFCQKTNGLSLVHVPFEIGQPGRADLPSKNEVDVLALPYVHIPTAASLED